MSSAAAVPSAHVVAVDESTSLLHSSMNHPREIKVLIFLDDAPHYVFPFGLPNTPFLPCFTEQSAHGSSITGVAIAASGGLVSIICIITFAVLAKVSHDMVIVLAARDRAKGHRRSHVAMLLLVAGTTVRLVGTYYSMKQLVQDSQ